jgi:hypothetical protein
MGLRKGDVLVLDQVGDGELRLRVARHVVAELRGSYAVDGSLVEDLERERRAEARREESASRGVATEPTSSPESPSDLDRERGA